jgi:hypothetical protein
MQAVFGGNKIDDGARSVDLAGERGVGVAGYTEKKGQDPSRCAKLRAASPRAFAAAKVMGWTLGNQWAGSVCGDRKASRAAADACDVMVRPSQPNGQARRVSLIGWRIDERDWPRQHPPKYLLFSRPAEWDDLLRYESRTLKDPGTATSGACSSAGSTLMPAKLGRNTCQFRGFLRADAQNPTRSLAFPRFIAVLISTLSHATFRLLRQSPTPATHDDPAASGASLTLTIIPSTGLAVT